MAKFRLTTKFVQISLESDFEGFQSPEVRILKRSNNRQICIFGFHCIAKKYIKG
jgi:hypothetical protein